MFFTKDKIKTGDAVVQLWKNYVRRAKANDIKPIFGVMRK
jgi:hypothetical protein